jgi:uncharacterized glyoxalase superfamily protein PhnB
MHLGPVVPILRFFDEARMREFYLGYLGFEASFEYRSEPEAPLYLGVARNGCLLHLSEHHGDGSPGANLRIVTDGLDAFHAELAAKGYKYYRPSIEHQPWGTRDMTIQDPFVSRLTFFDRKA